MSQLVVSRSKRAVPYPILGENTLVLSESMVLTEEDGELALMFRCPPPALSSQTLHPEVDLVLLPAELHEIHELSALTSLAACIHGWGAYKTIMLSFVIQCWRYLPEPDTGSDCTGLHLQMA